MRDLDLPAPPPPAPRPSRVAGFSLIEALIVLLVAGMALMLVFAIGGGSARTGFALGRRALAAADAEVARDELRNLIAALQLAPVGADPARLKLDPPAGNRSGFAADAVLARAGICGPAGPAGRVRVSIQSRPDGDAVICETAAGPPTVVADLSPRRARFSYSTDGVTWSDRWSPPEPAFDRNRPMREQAIYIRLASEDGLVDVVGRASSGPAWLYPPPPAR